MEFLICVEIGTSNHVFDISFYFMLIGLIFGLILCFFVIFRCYMGNFEKVMGGVPIRVFGLKRRYIGFLVNLNTS